MSYLSVNSYILQIMFSLTMIIYISMNANGCPLVWNNFLSLNMLVCFTLLVHIRHVTFFPMPELALIRYYIVIMSSILEQLKYLHSCSFMTASQILLETYMTPKVSGQWSFLLFNISNLLETYRRTHAQTKHQLRIFIWWFVWNFTTVGQILDDNHCYLIVPIDWSPGILSPMI